MKKFLILITCFLLILFIGAKMRIVQRVFLTINDLNRKILVTENKEIDFIKNIFEQRIQTLDAKNGEVSIEFKKLFVFCENDGKTQAKILLKTGDEFLGLPDDHGSIKYKLLKIDVDGIDMGYESRFDHRSFGRNLITIDKGVVHLLWKK